MNLRVERTWALALLGAVVVAAALFVYLLGRFGGPTLRFSEPYEVSAVIPDARDLSPRAEVLVHGVHVGEVQSASTAGGRTRVSFSLDSTYAPLRSAATIRVAEKTLFGEPYLDLDLGPSGSAPLDSGAELPRSQVLPASVDVDEALKALDPAARADLKGSLKELASGARSSSSQQSVSDTLAGLAETTSRLRELVGTLRGEAGSIAQGVHDGDLAVQSLGEREAEIRRIVRSGHVTLTALGSRAGDLRRAVAELPALLVAARSTLGHARPLISEASPVAADLTRAARPLAAALRDVPPTVRRANAVLGALPNLEPVATSFLDDAARVVRLVGPTAGPLGDALRNLQPIGRFLAARRDTFAAWFSNTGDLGASRDAKGHFARFFVGFEPGTATGTTGNFENNAYTRPHDAAHNRPYSGYSRLRAYDPGGSK